MWQNSMRKQSWGDTGDTLFTGIIEPVCGAFTPWIPVQIQCGTNITLLSPAFSQGRRMGAAWQSLEKEAFTTQMHTLMLYSQGRHMASIVSKMSYPSDEHT